MHCIAVYCTALQRYRRSVGGRAQDWIETESKVGALLLLLPLIKGLLSCLKISSKKYNNSDAIRPDDILFLGGLVKIKTMPGWEIALTVFYLLLSDPWLTGAECKSESVWHCLEGNVHMSTCPHVHVTLSTFNLVSFSACASWSLRACLSEEWLIILWRWWNWLWKMFQTMINCSWN